MQNLLLIYAMVVSVFAGISLIARNRAVSVLRRDDPALYRAALSELAPVPISVGQGGGHPSTQKLHGWLRRRQRHADLQGHRGLRAWIMAHDLAVSGIVLMLGSLALVLMRY